MDQPIHPEARAADAADAEVVAICQELVRIDSSNYGPREARGETEVARLVGGLLSEIGVRSRIYESEPGRPTLVAEWAPEGTDMTRPALLLHGHSDVVPAVAADWTVDPFSGELRDGCLCGRGTLDMKGYLAMVLSAIRARHRRGQTPSRPVRFILFADEEGSGTLGSTWLAEHHPEVFDGVTEAISEVGGFSVTAPGGQRVYVVQTAEKGLWWFRMTTTGSAGHGSMRNPDNAVSRLAQALGRISDHSWPDLHHPAQEEFLSQFEQLWSTEVDHHRLEESLAPLGPLSRMVAACSANTVTPTVLTAGYKVNVIPTRASAELDARFIPGHEQEMIDTIKGLAGPGVEFETISRKPSAEAPFEGPAVGAIRSALAGEDPGAIVLPYLNSAGTDAKGFARLPDGRVIHCYGCTPLRLPSDFDFISLFHGVDERVPLETLAFGARVVDRILQEA
ncbi:M20/M25/M40 family metallo-hydrolase [Acidipropionibacterium virtanenii]|uniref:Putative succinyl-diaminopimelate desuccinylase n=1 Tax=Acidipropionibacterium virtanenii TaxID=2057246 RepID=A0A344UTF1_9ACTN|nr:M20/M25/M40 family metallo-hydrolase [Acidipropionibacterium virtanenii]AXE38549.1 putative succinyl-diaminopimelate desuccinylase [Acidipropionibacterium virtanenii]